MIAKKLLTTIAFAFVLLFSGCAEDDFVGVDGLCPLVVSTVPEDGATDVPLNQIITATFNEIMDPATINGSSFTISANGKLITGTVTYNGLTATFRPSSLLEPDTEYTGTITTLAKDPRGNALQENYVWTFTTLPEYLVVVSSNPLIGGITTGGGVFLKGTPVTVNAVPNAGYTFTNWTSGGVQVSTSPSYTFVLMGDRTLVANYTLIPPTQFAVTTVASPPAGGSTTGGGAYDQGTLVTVTAAANTGYNFVNWTVGGVQVSVNPNYSFVLTANTNLVANFILKTYTIVLSSNPLLGGNTSGAGTFNYGTTRTVTATANANYTFNNWTENGVVVPGAGASYQFVLTGNRTLVANFTAVIPQFTITLISDTNQGTTLGAGTFPSGSNRTVEAIAKPGYTFSNWTENNVIVPLAGANYTFVLLQNRTLTANFTATPPPTGGLCDPNAVDLGLARSYAILAESGISNTPGELTSIIGDMGVSPAAATFITGFNLILPAGGAYSTSNLVTGKIYAPGYAAPTPTLLNTAILNMRTAFTVANGLPPTVTELYGGDINNRTLTSGVYKFGTGLLLTNTIILDGQNNNCAPFIFQIAGDLTVATNTKIILINGAKADNIYWVVSGAGATIRTNVSFEGTILSKTLIAVQTGSTVNGRLLAQTAVTLDANTVVMPK